MKIRSIVALARPVNSLTVGGAVVVGEIVALRSLPSIHEALLGFLTGLFISSSAMVLNDYFDVEVDKVNAPHRPLPMETISIPEAMLLATAASAAGLIAAGLLSWLNLAIAAMFWMVGFLYNWRFKATGLPGNVLVSTSVGIPFIYGGVSVGDPSNMILWSFFVVAFLANMGREVAKGIIDVRGDELRDAKTVARMRGAGVAAHMSSLFLFSAILFSFVPYLLGWLGGVYVAMIMLSDVVMAYPALELLRSRTPMEVRRRKRQILLGMFLGLLAFVVGGVYA